MLEGEDYDENKMSTDDDSGDEMFQLTQKALFVEHPTRPIDLETVPRDGSEFIHRSRLEDANLAFKSKVEDPGKPPEENEQKLLKTWAREKAAAFGYYALALQTDRIRDNFKKNYPRRLKFPGNGPADVQKWCVFCLGSEMCSKIYGEKYEGPSREVEGNQPLLSIVVHFDQYTAYTVLKHLHEWFLSIGMEESLGRWVWGVLACTRKPVDDNTRELMETFDRDCEKRLKDCDEFERNRIYMFSAILECYFCIYSDSVGPTLESFLNLKI